jgi:nucleotide-binding universal stress UspA family protein
MYKRILLPVDGSESAQGSVAYAARLAKAIGAALTAVHVTAPYRDIAIGEIGAYLPEGEYKSRAAANAAAILNKVKAAAAAEGLAVSVHHVSHSHPWEAIIQMAKKEGADLIVMASHGRRGLESLLIGSETKKVLTHSTIPVLVWRA